MSYNAEFQDVAANQLEKLPGESPVAVLVKDYGQLRKACRAIANG